MNRSLGIRPIVSGMPESQIREVANVGMGVSGVLPFWFGESDIPTAPEVRSAAEASLARGETFYTHNLGLPELRQAIADYVSALHGHVGQERIAVTSSGVNALMLANQLLLDAGDEVVAITPVWPNLVWQPRLLGAHVRELSLSPGDHGWQLDLDALFQAVTPATRLLILSSPNNPTGWTLTRSEQQAILDHCRRTGAWILADEVYERLYYVEASVAAPSFLDLAEPEDRLIVAQSFSKAFLMTGWRLGWLTVPASVLRQVGALIEYNTSCAPVFVQRAGQAAIEATADVAPLVAHFKRCRDTLVGALNAVPQVETVPADGGMYVLLKLCEYTDSLALAKRLVVEAKLGLAPGSAFGPAGEGWLRWCFASRDPQRLVQGVQQLTQFLETSAA